MCNNDTARTGTVYNTVSECLIIVINNNQTLLNGTFHTGYKLKGLYNKVKTREQIKTGKLNQMQILLKKTSSQMNNKQRRQQIARTGLLRIIE